MKQIIALLLTVGAISSAAAQPGVGVSIGINQPGVYGRINIGDVPPPALVLPQPVLISPPLIAVQRAPIYLYVPPTHQQNWRRYCGQYHACGQRVYFVREEWVQERYQEEHPDWDHGKKHNHGHDKEDKGDKHDHGKHHGHDGDERGDD